MSAQPEEIMVFAAASLTESFEEIGEKFKEKKNVNKEFCFNKILDIMVLKGWIQE
ncbi:hypothetical protein [Petroclostridium xylanilyticum]|uniref:hypothetical protein n=1 Tax=Petroclostridium xylanilyticum TaxID=1792311 RepID=UPI0012FFC3B7|nr:hypothetical protein [Petroclostridium xylanilyticum]